MAGMNVLGSPEISDYKGRTVTINVTGVCQQSVLKTGNYQVRVPYSQMSQAMQTITRQGGKVASVQLGGNRPVGGSADSGEDSQANEPQAEEQTATDEAADEGKKSSKRKRR